MAKARRDTRQAVAVEMQKDISAAVDQSIPADVYNSVVLAIEIPGSREANGSEAGMFDVVPCRTDEPAVKLRRRIRQRATLDSNPSSG